MKKLSLIHYAMLCFLVFACSSNARRSEVDKVLDTTDIVHFNIIIAPDLSSRLDHHLYPRPVSDNEIARLVTKNFYPKLATYRRTENQQDQLRVGFINKKVISEHDIATTELQIDLGQFENQLDRIDYIKGRSKHTFTQDTSKFIDEFSRLTSLSQTQLHGADIWSYFNNDLDNIAVRSKEQLTSYNKRVYRNKHRNILILLTDGYIEAGIYKNGGCPLDQRECYYLSKARISDFRKEFAMSKAANLGEYFNQSGYRIIPAQNSNLNNLEVLVLELYDRSLSKNGTPTVYPTDMDIMSLFWMKWLADSKLKRFELRPMASSKEEAEKAIMDFILQE